MEPGRKLAIKKSELTNKQNNGIYFIDVFYSYQNTKEVTNRIEYIQLYSMRFLYMYIYNI